MISHCRATSVFRPFLRFRLHYRLSIVVEILFIVYSLFFVFLCITIYGAKSYNVQILYTMVVEKMWVSEFTKDQLPSSFFLPI